jgi:uncharacterized phage-associated protein
METTANNTKYPSAVIANWFLEKEPAMKSDIMKVLKLVYIAHGFHLAFKDTPLIEEDVQAWQYGPVIPELYFRLKTKTLGITSDYISNWEAFEKDDETQRLLEAVYRKYGRYTGGQLSNLTHKQNTPWDLTVTRFKSLIEEDLIKAHYKELLRKATNK